MGRRFSSLLLLGGLFEKGYVTDNYFLMICSADFNDIMNVMDNCFLMICSADFMIDFITNFMINFMIL